ncbi:MAG: ABC transporter permease [Bacteroidales bacterium]|nr:ABC transporter permease [Bacteroidales bacterium]MCF8334695.1 ABC transporter permease [Bacteroidales bacterium]
MLKNFILIALRNLKKQREFALITILGLGIGIAVSALIMRYVMHEYNFDRFHENKDRIYRIMSDVNMPNGKSKKAAVSSGDIGKLVTEKLPQVEAFTRFNTHSDVRLKHNERQYTISEFTYADSTFFNMFSFELLRGNPEKVLTQPNSAVLSASAARKVFGDNEAINKTITIDERDFKVTGIMADFPTQSHLQFDVLGSMNTVDNPQVRLVERNGLSFPTYFLVRDNAEITGVIEEFKKINREYMKERFGGIGITVNSTLQPMTNVYLHTTTDYQFFKSGSYEDLIIFSLLAIFILIIALINFINLITARSETRYREIGMRKVLGAERKHLIRQFIGEAMITVMISLILGLVITELFLPVFNNLMGTSMSGGILLNPDFTIAIILGVLVTGLIAGAYPAFYMSSFRPAFILKGTSQKQKGNAFLQKSLVVLQFGIAVFLAIAVTVLYHQVDFMKNKSLGFDKEHVVTVGGLSKNLRESRDAIRNELVTNTGIKQAAFSASVPGKSRNINNVYVEGQDPETGLIFNENRVLKNYFDTYGIHFISGEPFKNYESIEDKCILNQTGINKLDLKNPIGKKVVLFQNTYEIIGIVKDFNFASFHKPIEPLIFTANSHPNYLSVKLEGNRIQESIGEIKTTIAGFDPNFNFDYNFVDKQFEKKYQKEEQKSKILLYAVLLAIFISMMGLFALTSLTIQRRLKEIAIRKTLGASLQENYSLLARDLLKWVVIANLVAWPLAFAYLNNWLEQFASHIAFQAWHFLVPGMASVIITLLTISFITIKAGRTDPARILTYE